MFESYSREIDPEDAGFQTYITQYVSNKDPRRPETIPYSKLYGIIKEGIRAYIHKKQTTE